MDDRIPMGQMDLGDLPHKWDRLAQQSARLRSEVAARPPQVIHARMIDEGQTSGVRTYMAAERFLAMASDNHKALVSLLGHYGATQYAPWNLLRPTFEAAFYVVWLLEPDESVERRRRGLTLEWFDQREHLLYFEGLRDLRGHIPTDEHDEWDDEFARIETVAKKNEETYRKEAAVLKMDWPLPKQLNLLDALGKLRFAQRAPGMGTLLQGAWRTLSGMQHGRGSTLLRGTDRSQELPIDGGVRAVLAINDEAFVSTASITATFHLEALDLMRKRSVPA